jgi:hypothetical protein
MSIACPSCSTSQSSVVPSCFLIWTKRSVPPASKGVRSASGERAQGDRVMCTKLMETPGPCSFDSVSSGSAPRPYPILDPPAVFILFDLKGEIGHQFVELTQDLIELL